MNSQLADVGIQASDPRTGPMIQKWNDAQTDGKADYPLLHEAYGEIVGLALNVAQEQTKKAREEADQAKGEAAQHAEAEQTETLTLESGPSAGGGGALSNQEWITRWSQGLIAATPENTKQANKLMDDEVYPVAR